MSSFRRCTRTALAIAFACVGLAQEALANPPIGSEVCDYSGQLEGNSGHLWARTMARRSAGDRLSLRVIARLTAGTVAGTIDYSVDEITEWQGQRLNTVAINLRNIVGSSVSYQKWDRFARNGDAFEGYRAQSKFLHEMQSRFPRLAPLWAAQLGGNWLPELLASPAERRTDLDLPANLSAPGLRTPLAQALYFVRFQAPTTRNVPIFLAGEKRQKRIDLNLAGQPSADGGVLWRTRIDIGEIRNDPNEPAQVVISRAQELLSLQFRLRHPSGSAAGSMRPVSCQVGR